MAAAEQTEEEPEQPEEVADITDANEERDVFTAEPPLPLGSAIGEAPISEVVRHSVGGTPMGIPVEPPSSP